MDWVYVTLGPDGRLREDDGALYCSDVFTGAVDAEAYLAANDCRASLR